MIPRKWTGGTGKHQIVSVSFYKKVYIRLCSSCNLVITTEAYICQVYERRKPVEMLVTIFWVLKIIGALGTIAFTYVKHKDYKKEAKKKAYQMLEHLISQVTTVLNSYNLG